MAKKIDYTYNFNTIYRTLPTEGNLVYEYNPFYNYRLNRTMVFYKNRLWELSEIADELGITYNEGVFKDSSGNVITSWDGIVPKTETPPVVYQKGQLTNFETNELHFSLNNPVNIIPQYSYDDSVNLIINDGINPPRLINSRFSATERNKYEIRDRVGNNDTNIYDQGTEFDVDTSLYKKIVNIPQVQFLGVGYGGNLKIGNYHFYFRYIDDDGNMSDFFAESGLVSIFIGNNMSSIYSGFREENSHKLVRFTIGNTDPSYKEILVYYTKATSDINENATVTAYKIDRKYLISDSGSTVISITGFEEVDQVDITEINPMYQIYGSAETQEQCQNRLFLANTDKPKIPYQDLADCALRFLPYMEVSLYPIESIKSDYSGSITNTYYDPSFIYNKTGYHYDEIYRFGIVFILKDNTLSEVFNVRGTSKLTTDAKEYSHIKFKNGEERVYINYDEQYYNIVTDGSSITKTENAKGVVKIPSQSLNSVIGINFEVDKEVIEYLTDILGVKGIMFVRQKRLPTTLCQAYTVGIDKESHIPVIPQNGEYIAESFLTKYNKDSKDSLLLTNEKKDRIRKLKNYDIYDRSVGAICPEYDVNSPYFNSLFTGTDFVIKEQSNNVEFDFEDDRHFTLKSLPSGADNTNSVKIIGVEDNTKLVAINDYMFSARAGEAEEAFRYEYLGYENNTKEADNLIRGSFGPYLGIANYKNTNSLINIKIPGYSEANLQQYFEIRYHDKSPYYPISYRIDLSKPNKWFKDDTTTSYTLKNALYRGDCYICQFTHRINRNFQSPSTPTNDKIVDQYCWRDNYDVSDGVVKTENFEKINLGDVNAVRLGMYITVWVRSTYNLNIRALDSSNADEIGMFGHARGFYPYYSMSNEGSYKIPEALCYNKGFEKSLSEKYYYEVPDVPWIKNEFSNRIAYSEIQVTNAFENGWRTFFGTSYRDYPKTYGSIVKLVEFSGNLICVFEHGVALIPVNERAVAAQGSGGYAYINTSNVLPENPKILSHSFGSQWRDSVIKTPRAVYGVDTIARKIWKTDGNTFECISDFKVQEFLNQNISLTERELEPVIGIRNVKTHYNKFKQDIMFTFYDNLHGFEEKVWNLCYNELQQKWITFYSWVPSYSENIYNQYFSFDRNTSKWITKLGISKTGNDFSDGVVLTKNIIPNDAKGDLENNPGDNYIEYEIPNPNYDKEKPESDENPRKLKRYGYIIGSLDLANRTLPSGDGIEIVKDYELVPDTFGNWKNFGIDKNLLYLKTDAVNLCSELFVRGNNKEISTLETIQIKNGNWQKLQEGLYRVYENDSHPRYVDYDPKIHRCVEKETSLEITLNFYSWLNNCVINSNYPIYKDDSGRRINLSTIDSDRRLNGNKIVSLLNIRANIIVTYNGKIPSLAEAYTSGFKNGTQVNAGYYESVVAVIPQYNMQFLTTDFWKHGQAGIIDIADKIYPTYWYGKQHPFEFEFIVADNPQLHKIFDNLEIISNSAEPESFHYEIVGDCYEFAKDKKNMYIRQEATKELYQNNGYNVSFDHNYSNLHEEHRPLITTSGTRLDGMFDKSTLFPLYYSRQDTINEIEDSYHLKDNVSTKDFSALSGAEVVRYNNSGEYRIWNHAKAIDLNYGGRIRGNMHYKEDKWNVQINPINIVQKNEKEWGSQDLGNRPNLNSSKIPIEIGQSPIPNEVLSYNNGQLTIPDNSIDRAIVSWKWEDSQISEAKLKDKWIKIRVRYKGDKLAIITAIRTLYSASYA